MNFALKVDGVSKVAYFSIHKEKGFQNHLDFDS